MSNVSPVLTTLPQHVLDVLTNTVKFKFNAYFAFTSPAECVRSVENVPNASGHRLYTYSDASMISDLTVLCSLFIEVYESLRTASRNVSTFNAHVAKFFAANPTLQFEFNRIIEDGEFWSSSGGVGSLQPIPLASAVPNCLPEIWRTLRNGFAHVRWRYDDLSALDYWTRQGWDTAAAQPAFNLQTRVAHNYTAYIVDAKKWKPDKFWQMENLRIVVTQFGTLRYHLHRFLNVVLNGSSTNVFGGEPTEAPYTHA